MKYLTRVLPIVFVFFFISACNTNSEPTTVGIHNDTDAPHNAIGSRKNVNNTINANPEHELEGVNHVQDVVLENNSTAPKDVINESDSVFGDFNQDDVIYYIVNAAYSIVPSFQGIVEWPPGSILFEAGCQRLTFEYGLINLSYDDLLHDFKHLLEESNFEIVEGLGVHLDPFNNVVHDSDVVYGKSKVFVSIEKGEILNDTSQLFYIRVAHINSWGE